jgi:hypothetical protein
MTTPSPWAGAPPASRQTEATFRQFVGKEDSGLHHATCNTSHAFALFSCIASIILSLRILVFTRKVNSASAVTQAEYGSRDRRQRWENCD